VGITGGNPLVEFTTGQSRVTARIVDAGAVMTVIVPTSATSGPVRVTESGAVVDLPFTLTTPPPIVKSATLAASAKNHDLLKQPAGLAVLLDGTAFTADSGHDQLRAILANGSAGLVVSQFRAPEGVAFDRMRKIFYVADSGNHVIRVVTMNGTVSTLAGSGRSEDRDGTGALAGFKQPTGLAVDGAGNLYVADTGNDKVRKVTPTGVVTTIAGAGRPGFANGSALQALFKAPRGVAVGDDGTIYVADSGNHVIRRVENGFVFTHAGTGHPGDLNGSANNAEFTEPAGLALDESGRLFVADSGNHQIRSVASGQVTTVAGSGQPGFVDASPLSSVAYHQASGIAAEGAIFIADTMNDAIRVLYRSVVLTDVYPRRGDPNGAESIRIFGAGFVPGQTQVTFGGVDVAVVYVSSTELRIKSPAGAIGTADIIVTTPGGSAALDDVFEYVPPFISLSISPAAPSVNAGQTLSLTVQALAGDGISTDVTSLASWSSANPVIATVTSGLVRGVAPGLTTVTTTFAGLSASTVVQVNAPFVALSISPLAPVLDPGQSLPLTAYGRQPNGALVDVTGLVSWFASDPTVAAIEPSGVLRGLASGSTSVTATYLGISASVNVTVRASGPQIPPDPAQIAPPLDLTVGTNVYDATRFLYKGPSAIQIGVTDVIEPRRVSIVRGRVLGGDGTPLPGARVFAPGSAGLGSTLTRADGGFDFVHNGGGTLVLAIEKEGFLPVERTLDTAWQHYATTEDIVMLQFDEHSTRLELASTAIQVARGRTVTDANGPRQSTLLLPAGTTATMVMEDGSERPLPSITIRSTEYSVGERGPQAMPAGLPTQSGYTYCVELSSDEAVVARARTVRFNHPVIHYVENFLDFPVGGIVPSGYYDRREHAWIGAPNGRVVRIVEISGGAALVDITGDGAADDATALAAIGLTAAEQQQLAALYSAGTSLWRVPLPHLTPWDFNWPFGPPSDALAPGVGDPLTAPHVQDAHCQSGSVIDCENLVIGESIPIVGTPYALHYRSDRVGGRKAASEMKIAVTGPSVPSSMRRAVVEIEIAGRKFVRTFPAQPNLSFTFTWDERDAYGRKVQGPHPADVSIGYVYPAVYQTPDAFASSFAQFSGVPMGGDGARAEITLWQRMSGVVHLGVWQQPKPGFGGWSLTPHHAYIPSARVAMLGDGRQQNADETKEQVRIRTGRSNEFPHGIPAINAILNGVSALAYAPDGTLYILHGDSVSRIDPAGMIWNFVNSSGIRGYSGDGGRAVDARIDPSQGKLVVGRDGSVYLADRANGRIRRIDGNGTITSIAGGGQQRRDGVPATQSLIVPIGLAFAPDGSLYAGDPPYIRRITPDGIISTVAGSGRDPVYEEQAQGTAARQSSFGWPESLHFDANGDLLIVEYGRILRLGANGRVSNIAGRYGAHANQGDGGPANSAYLAYPTNAIPMPDGGILISGSDYLRRISPSGIITHFAGADLSSSKQEGSLLSVRLPRASAALSPTGEITVGFIFSNGAGLVAGIAPPLPGYNAADVILPDPSASLLYHFDASGRHLKTLNADRMVPELEFEYGPGGLLTAIRDRIGNRTTIERSGATVRIIAPRGRTTTLTLDTDGYLERVRTPAGRETVFDYDMEGQLTSMTSPEGRFTSFGHDAGGLLSRHMSAGTKQRTLQRTASGTTGIATVRTGLGRVWSYTRSRLISGTRRTVTDPAGKETTTQVSSDAATRARTTPDGTTTTVTAAPDQRFGMGMPVLSSSTRFPSGLQNTATRSRTFEFSGGVGSTTILERTDTVAINGKVHRRAYSLSDRTVSWISPAGRRTTATLDTQHRVTRVAIPGIAPVDLTYDPMGRMKSVSQDARSMTMTYDASDLVTSFTDHTGRSASYLRDGDGLVQSTTSQAGTIGFGYDGDRKLTSVALATDIVHRFTHTSAGAPDSYTPPGGGAIRYGYDADDTIASILFPTGSSIDFGYDDGGRLHSISTAAGTYGFQYSEDGALAVVTAPGGVSTAYVEDGGVVKEVAWSGPVTGDVRLAYDADRKLQTESAAGTAVAFTYDSDGLLTAAGALSMRRDAQNGLLTGTTLGEAVDAWGYNTFAEPIQYTAIVNGSVVYSNSLTRGVQGRIATMTNTVEGLSSARQYTHDAAGRLKQVSIGGTPIAEYDYDARGNRTGHRAPGVDVTATYDQQDRLLRYGDQTYTYTETGYLQTSSLAGATTTYSYDDLGNLRSVNLPGLNIQYIVDGQQRRIGKRVNDVLVQAFLYSDQLRVNAELNGESQLVSRFIYGARTNAPEYMIRGGATYRFILDHVGSPRLVVNVTTGAVAQRLDYDDFGNVLSDTNPGFQPFGFAGGLYDRDTRLVRFGARDYDPHTGRWTAKDPLLFAGGDTNLYAYAKSDPVNLIDPSGLLFGGAVNAGEVYGQAALAQYADLMTDPDSAWYEVASGAVGGFFSALWLPCTSDSTFNTLSIAYSLNAYVGRSFWQYYPANNPAYRSRWMTRGSGWDSPFTLGDEAAGNLALPSRNPATAVREVPNSWNRYVAGPRPVSPANGRAGGATEYYQGWRFPD
jgi:RHS repeat-associated protein